MKSVIVFYIPPRDVYDVSTKSEPNQFLSAVNPIFDKGAFESDFRNDFHIVCIEDPARDKVETEVFFTPE
jgi:hypothetical protein